MEPDHSASPARVLRADLGAGSGSFVVEGAGPGAPGALGRLGGGALALALLSEDRAGPGRDDVPLVVAVGECVRRGVPTAARATVASRSPLSGLLAEGQVGGDLARRLARVGDALAIRGRTDVPGAVLVVEGDGTARVESVPALAGVAPGPAHTLLVERFGPCASLRAGPAGARGVPIASLASGGTEPSFVGRGGLGAVLGRTGLAAVCVTADEVPSMHAGEDLAARLASSPRLVARAEGGSFELLLLAAARGDLPAERAASLHAEAMTAPHARKGCRGCPTPCGWVFERPEASASTGGAGGRTRQHARFNAAAALGTDLGLDGFDDALALLAACDAVGVDAKEVAAGLALLLEEEPAARGDRATLAGWIEDVGRGADARGLGEGAAALARRLGRTVPTARGQAVRPEAGLAAVLGQCVTPGGADPMRSFPFLLEAGGRARIEALLAPVPLPPGAEDPDAPAGKGRLVWWHENLVAAVDTTGFCAFSAAGLLSDGLTDLDELAEWILPRALLPPRARAGERAGAGRRLLELGAAVVDARRALERAWGAPADVDRPEWARGVLDLPGMLDEYRECRTRGAPPPDAAGEPTAARAVEPRSGGAVRVRASGPLAARLGAESVHVLAAPAPLGELLAALGLPADGTGPAVYRDGRRLGLDDPVGGGDTLDLLVAIAGGSCRDSEVR